MKKPIDREKREADLKVRLKLFTTNATTYAYAIMGASFFALYQGGGI